MTAIRPLPLMSAMSAKRKLTATVRTTREAVVVSSGAEFVDAERQETAEDQGDQGDGEDDDLDALGALLGPVHVVQVQDERELVQDEAHPDPEEHRRDTGAEAAPAAGERDEAAEDHQHHTGHDMVHMDAARA